MKSVKSIGLSMTSPTNHPRQWSGNNSTLTTDTQGSQREYLTTDYTDFHKCHAEIYSASKNIKSVYLVIEINGRTIRLEYRNVDIV